MNDNTDRYYEMPSEMPPLPSGTGRKASDAPVQEPAPTAGSKKKSVLLWVIPACVVLVAGIAALCWYLLTPSQQTSVIEKEGSASSKYYSALDPQKPQGTATQLSYGEWDGEIRLNQPHGQGTLTFTKQRLISQFDPQARVAHPGDYIIGEYDTGQLVRGRLYRTDGHAEDIIISQKQ